jgi:hypothetical protein
VRMNGFHLPLPEITSCLTGRRGQSASESGRPKLEGMPALCNRQGRVQGYAKAQRPLG